MTRLHIQLFSGGLDSFAMWHVLGQPQPVYVRYGHKYESQELETICRLEQADPSLRVTRLVGPQIGGLEQSDGHIPHRNLLLIGTAVAALQPRVVYLGVLRGETSRDKSRRFLRQTSKLLSFSEQPVRVRSPSKQLTKTQLVAKFIRLFPDLVERLQITRSCYADSDVPCGRCMACFRRWVAMSNNGIRETYQVEPWQNVRWDAGMLTYLRRTPLTEWPGVIHNNLEAAAALWRVRRVASQQGDNVSEGLQGVQDLDRERGVATMIRVNTIYGAIQGEGVKTGVPMVILRLQGCSVGCPFCDTSEAWDMDDVDCVPQLADAQGQNPRWTQMQPNEITAIIRSNYPTYDWVLITGGEPAEQDLSKLVEVLHEADLRVALETSGTASGHLGAGVDWVCVSPKIGMPGCREIIPEVIRDADEIKHVIGKQAHIDQLDQLLVEYGINGTKEISLQPMSQGQRATALCVETVQQRRWQPSVQIHKYVKLP